MDQNGALSGAGRSISSTTKKKAEAASRSPQQQQPDHDVEAMEPDAEWEILRPVKLEAFSPPGGGRVIVFILSRTALDVALTENMIKLLQRMLSISTTLLSSQQLN